MIFKNRNAKPTLVWTAMDKAQKIKLRRILQLLRLRRTYRCIIIVPTLHMKWWRRIALTFLGKIGLVRIIIVSEGLDFFYSELDNAATETSEGIAHRAVNELRESLASYDWSGLDLSEQEDIYLSVRLSLANTLYAGIRSAIGLNAIIGAESSGEIFYFDVHTGRPDREAINNSIARIFVNRSQIVNFSSWIDHKEISQPLDSVILATYSRMAYIDAVDYISRGEAIKGNTCYVLFPGNPERGTYKDYFNNVMRGKFIYSRRNPISSRLKMETAPVKFSLPIEDFRGFEGGAYLVQRVMAIIIRSQLPIMFARLASPYMQIRDNPHFAGVSTVFATPSRSPISLSLLHLFRRRGARVVEYQPFFWSAHPRYEVRDLDLFVCSDEATMQIVQEKYRALGSDTPVILGPSFAMGAFLDRFQTALAARAEGDSGRYDIGVALQPMGLEQFEEACSRMQAAGLRLLIRAHPVMDRALTEQRFGPYGTLDGGTLEDFLIDCRGIVTGFSNVAVQATACGRPAVCLPQPEGLGLDLSVASSRILICQTMEDLMPLVQSAKSLPFQPPEAGVMERWMQIRRDLDAGVYDRAGRGRAGMPTTV